MAAFATAELHLPAALALAACASSFACAAIAGHAAAEALARGRRIRRIHALLAVRGGPGRRRVREPLAVAIARQATKRLQQSAAPARAYPLAGRGSAKAAELILRAGLEGQVTPEGFVQARLLWMGLLALAMALGGMLAAPQLSVPAACTGALVGWFGMHRSFKQRATMRSRQLESHLSEAVEVICLGLRGGMPFDRALGLYCACFDSLLASELRAAAGIWQAGMLSREQALRNLASSYESAVFSRVVDSIVRSMRFGTPLADALEVLAGEARASHRARVQEQVMKAPVKMMVPIGTLILPSMMLLVLGPVLLQLLDGF